LAKSRTGSQDAEINRCAAAAAAAKKKEWMGELAVDNETMFAVRES
jgi:hypothetical protein